MKMNGRSRCLTSVAGVLAILLASSQASFTLAQEASDKEADAPQPVTTGDPDIAPDQLQWLVKPLTQEELVIEADAWRDLLKAKVSQLAQSQVQVKEHKEKADEAAEKKEEKEGKAKAAGDQVAATVDQEVEEREKNAMPRLRSSRNSVRNKLCWSNSSTLYSTSWKKKVVRSSRTANTLVPSAGSNWMSLMPPHLGRSSKVGSHPKKVGKGGCGTSLSSSPSLSFRISRQGFWRHLHGERCRGSRVLHNSCATFLGKIVKQLVMVIGLIVALSALEVNISPLLAALGAAGFVIGLALQGTLSNFASGLLILAYQPFDVGDVIEAAGVSGIVDSVSLFSTHIRTFDNKVMIVPNNDIWGGTITNSTATDTRRVDMTFGIGYDDDVEKAKEILQRLVNEHELVLEEPAPVVQMNELGDSSVNFICRPWTKTSDYWSVYWDLTRDVKSEFEKAGISIPFPQQDVHVYHQGAVPAE